MTEGERRIYTWISKSMSARGLSWRGCHVLQVVYITKWPICGTCKQAIRTDSDLAYRMFCEAKLFWDGKAINHDELRQILLQTNELAVNSNGGFRYPGTYGLDPFREWGRRELGLCIVIADLDYAVRRYGERFGLDAEGDLMLIEKKERWPQS